MSDQEKRPGYLISFTRQIPLRGEMISVQTNLPVGATQEEIAQELAKIGGAIDTREQANG